MQEVEPLANINSLFFWQGYNTAIYQSKIFSSKGGGSGQLLNLLSQSQNIHILKLMNMLKKTKSK